jgi:hypothetical protein
MRNSKTVEQRLQSQSHHKKTAATAQVQQQLSSEADSCSAGQEIPCL